VEEGTGEPHCYTPAVSRADILRRVVANACTDLRATAEDRQALSAALAV
jgi:hypothetical protein